MRSRAHVSSHPIHPILISFPIGLWVTSFVFDLIAWTRQDALLASTGYYCIIAGCVGAALAALPGLIDLLSVLPPRSSAQQRGWIHGGLNTLALLLFIAIAARRGSPATAVDSLSILLSTAGVIGISVSGWLGGTLVYRNQIGIDRRYANAGQLKERVLEKSSQPLAN